jgi:hypothetical protein
MSVEQPSMHLVGTVVDEDWRPWYWRNCRSLDITVTLCLMPWDWHFRGQKDDQDGCDFMAYGYRLRIGPFIFAIEADIGNCSDYGIRGRFGLSEQTAWERADKYYAKRRRTGKGT